MESGPPPANPGLQADGIEAGRQFHGYAESRPIAGRRALEGLPHIRSVQTMGSRVDSPSPHAGAHALNWQTQFVKTPPANPGRGTDNRGCRGFVDPKLHPARS
jgi:hypothetical protein